MADHTLTILDECRIAPPPGTVGERCLPLTFFDLVWLSAAPPHQLFMYDFPHPKPHFTQTVLPTLKTSLSLTLKHFFPFSGNLLVFPDSRKPEIRHQEGDSVAFTLAESSLDFGDLVGNHPRSCHKFHNLVPRLGRPSKASSSNSSSYVAMPLFSVQVTLFPNSGFSIGLTNHHVLCDASTKSDFLKAWTAIAKHATDDAFLSDISNATSNLPFYGRVIEYPDRLDALYTNQSWIESVSDANYEPVYLVSHPTEELVRATFVLTRPHINLLKNQLAGKVEYASSYSVACAYVWTCMAKSGSKVDVEKFGCAVDWRGRMEPPLPPTYFGNCVGLYTTPPTKVKSLATNNGFVTAAGLIGKVISESIKMKKEDVIKDAGTWLEKFSEGVRVIGVAGTPKIRLYDTNFGWGKPRKYETVSLDYNGSISVNACRDSPEDIEIGLCLPAQQMDAFIAIF